MRPRGTEIFVNRQPSGKIRNHSANCSQQNLCQSILTLWEDTNVSDFTSDIVHSSSWLQLLSGLGDSHLSLLLKSRDGNSFYQSPTPGGLHHLAGVLSSVHTPSIVTPSLEFSPDAVCFLLDP